MSNVYLLGGIMHFSSLILIMVNVLLCVLIVNPFYFQLIYRGFLTNQMEKIRVLMILDRFFYHLHVQMNRNDSIIKEWCASIRDSDITSTQDKHQVWCYQYASSIKPPFKSLLNLYTLGDKLFIDHS